jgi:hypothetical protein
MITAAANAAMTTPGAEGLRTAFAQRRWVVIRISPTMAVPRTPASHQTDQVRGAFRSATVRATVDLWQMIREGFGRRRTLALHYRERDVPVTDRANTQRIEVKRSYTTSITIRIRIR